MDEAQQAPARQDWSFQLNPPTVVCLLYFATYFTGITAVVGVVLAYLWRREDRDGWEQSHYVYLIRTFWLAVLGAGAAVIAIAATVLLASDGGGPPDDKWIVLGVLVMVLLTFAFLVLMTVRCALSLVNAQRSRAMPYPRTWLA